MTEAVFQEMSLVNNVALANKCDILVIEAVSHVLKLVELKIVESSNVPTMDTMFHGNPENVVKSTSNSMFFLENMPSIESKLSMYHVRFALSLAKELDERNILSA